MTSIVFNILINETKLGLNKMKAAKANEIINRNLKGVFMQSMITIKGWSQLEARSYLVEFITCGTTLSLKDFMDVK